MMTFFIADSASKFIVFDVIYNGKRVLQWLVV